MRRALRLSLLALLSFGVSAGTISEFGGGTATFLNEYHFGQMVTTPADGPWYNITFCFAFTGLSGFTSCTGVSGGQFFYPGTLYLLSQQYLGLPSDLASAPGLLATSIGTSQSAWIFSSSVVLQPDTTYYFYEDGTWAGGVSIPGGPIGPFPTYMTQGWPNLNTPFQTTESMDFRLTGDLIPEPSPLTLLALGLLALLIARWRFAGVWAR
jgi:hypothetical protein